jgi:hypothetical protein
VPYADPEAQRAYQREWTARRRQTFFEDKTCERCGSAELLELNHRDPTQKVSHKIWSWSAKRRAEEIAKCEIVCRGCHRAEHLPILRELAHMRPRDNGRFVPVRETA